MENGIGIELARGVEEEDEEGMARPRSPSSAGICRSWTTDEAIVLDWLRGADAVLPMGDDEPDDACEVDDFYRVVDAVEDFFEAGIGVPLGAELHADVGEGVVHQGRADEGVDVELPLFILATLAGKGDEGADDRQHAPDEDGDGAEAVEEVIYAVQVVAAEKEIVAVALDHGAPAAGADPVGRDGAEVRGEGGYGCQEDEVHLRVARPSQRAA